MARITIVIPDASYEFLKRKALRESTSVESFLLHHVDRLVLEGRDEELRMARDPIYQLSSAHSSGLADLSSEHDHYLYRVARRS